MPIDLSRYIGLYMNDAREKLQIIKLQLIAMPHKETNDSFVYWQMVENVRLQFHHIAGSSTTIGFDEVAKFSRTTEKFLVAKIQEPGRAALTVEEISLLRGACSGLLAMVEAVPRVVGDRQISDLEVLREIWYHRICVNQPLRNKFRGQFALIWPGIVEPVGPFSSPEAAIAKAPADTGTVVNCLDISFGTWVRSGAEAYRSQWEAWLTKEW